MSLFKKLFGEKTYSGETAEFKALINGSMEALQLQTQAHQNDWGLGKSNRWDFAQDTGELVFTFPDMTARAPAQIIGSFDQQESTWMWAWANPSIADALKRDSVRVREYGEKHRIQRLTTPQWAGEEIDGWHMAALTSRLCEANGVYRGPAGATYVFFTFGKVQLTKKI